MRNTSLLLFLFSLALFSQVRAFAPLKELFRFNCDSSFELLSEIPLGLSLKIPILRNTVDAAFDAVFERAQCTCPGITREEFSIAYDPFAILLNNIHGQPEPLNSCLAQNFPRNLAGLGIFRVPELPSTCTYQSYSASPSACNLQTNFGLPNTKAQFSLSRCSNSWFPSISITCDGSFCSELLKPCHEESDCGDGFTCSVFDIPEETIATYAQSILAMAGIYAQNDTSTYGCFQTPGVGNEKTPENDIFTNLFTTFANTFFEEEGIFNKLAVCIPESVDISTLPLPEMPTSMPTSMSDIPIDVYSITQFEIGESPFVDVCFLPDYNFIAPIFEEFHRASQSGPLTWGQGLKYLVENNYCFGSSYIEGECPVVVQPNCSTDVIQFYSLYVGYLQEHSMSNNFPIPSYVIMEYIDRLIAAFNYFDKNGDGALLASELPFYNPPIFNPGVLVSTQVPELPIYSSFLKILKEIFYFLFSLSQSNPTVGAKEFSELRSFIVALSNQLNSWSPCSDLVITEEMVRILLYYHISDGLTNYDTDSSGILERENSLGDDELFEFEAHLQLISGYFTSTSFSSGDIISLVDVLMERSSIFQLDNSTDFSDDELKNIRGSSFGLMIVQYKFSEYLGSTINLESLTNNIIQVVDSAFIEEGPFVRISDTLDPNHSITYELIQNYATLSSITLGRPHEAIIGIIMNANTFIQFLDSNSNNFIDEEEFQNLFQIPSSGDISESQVIDLSKVILSTVASLPTSPMTTNDLMRFFAPNPLFLLSRHSTLVVHIPGLEEWDGYDSEGVFVPTKINVIPQFEKVSGQRNLFKITCDNKLIFENNNFGLVFNEKIDELSNRIVGLIKDIVECGQEPSIVDEHFMSNYALWTPMFWLALFDENVPDFANPNTEGFPFIYFQLPKIYNLPSSCNYERFKNDGICDFDFVGLKELFLLDITLRVSSLRCESEYFASYNIECLGEDCYLLDGLTACDDSCSGSLECNSIFNYILEFVSIFTPPPPPPPTEIPTWGPTPTNTNSGPYPTNTNSGPYPTNTNNGPYPTNTNSGPYPTPTPPSFGIDLVTILNMVFNEIESTDFIELALSSKYNTDLCSPFTLNSTEESLCFGESKWRNTLHNIIVKILGSSNQPSSLSTRLNFCFVPPEVILGADLFDWIYNLASFDGDYLYLGDTFRSTDGTFPENCPSTVGFPATPVGQNATAPLCPENHYGFFTRECLYNGAWGKYTYECQQCPMFASSPFGSDSIDDCICAPGFNLNTTSYQCDDVNECQTGQNDCAPIGSTCFNYFGSYFCYCSLGYSGDGKTCNDVDECQSGSYCPPNSVCANTIGSYTCPCKQGFEIQGSICVDVNECLVDNGGCSPNAKCVNTAGSRNCYCKTGYTGGGLICNDINECAVNRGGCSTNAICINTVGSSECRCKTGFQGDGFTCNDVNECLNSNGGCNSVTEVCVNSIGSFSCNCVPGYKKSNGICVDVNECLAGTSGCDLSSTDCVNSIGSFTCQCLPGYSSIPGQPLQCQGSSRTDSTNALNPAGRWLFNGNNIDSSLSNNNFVTGLRPFVTFAQNGDPTNKAIVLSSGNPIYTQSKTRFVRPFSLEIIFSVSSLSQAVEIVALAPNVTSTNPALYVNIRTNGALAIFRNSANIGVTGTGKIVVGQTNYLILTVRSNSSVDLFLNGENLGNFVYGIPFGTQSLFSRLGKRLDGVIDEYNILKSPINFALATDRFNNLA